MSSDEQDLRAQYATDANLRARMALHARFSTNPSWDTWIFERERPAPGARVLEVGCGPATLWRGRDLDPSWSLTLTDFTNGMVEAARRALGDRATYVVADVQDLPFDDGAFDLVIANHVLYHVPDRPRALAEIARVRTAGGSFHASTIGAGISPSSTPSQGSGSRDMQSTSDSRPAHRRSPGSSTTFASSASTIAST